MSKNRRNRQLNADESSGRPKLARRTPIWNRIFLPGHNRQLLLSAASALLLMAVLLSVITLRQSEEALSSRIAPGILRFHVLANSDSETDQSLKMEVKQVLIDAMYEGLQKEAAGRQTEGLGAARTHNKLLGDDTADVEIHTYSKEMLIDYVLTHREELETLAEEYMSKNGFPYSAAIRLEQCYFPTKIYGDMVFPCGTYDAVRVLLGDGEGRNWWCVLYPPLCFTDNACGQVPESSKQELRNLLTDEDYMALAKNRRVVFGDVRPSDRKSADSPQTMNREATGNRGKGQNQENIDSAGVTVRVRFRLADLLSGKDR